MHESGAAIAVAAEIRDRRLDPGRVRVLIFGGHGDPAAFEAAFRAHLVAAGPGLGLEAVTIGRRPSSRLCAACTKPFDATDPSAACPACGGAGLAVAEPESIELEWDEGPDGRGPDSPIGRDPRHSTNPASEPDALSMTRPAGCRRT